MVPVFFLLVLSCGVPTYLYIGDAEIQIDTDVVVEHQDFTVTINLTEDALSEFQDKNTIPAMKLFYVISTNSLAGSAVSSLSSLPVSTNSKSAFRSLFIKTGGNGDMWTPQSDSRATGFYIYDTEDSSTKYSASRPPFNEDTDYDVIVASTFSYSDTATGEGDLFATAPSMDLAMPVGEFQPDTTTPPFNTYTFSIRALDTTGEYSTIGLYDQDDDLIGYMNNERKDRFFGAAAALTADAIQARYTGYDEVSYRVLIDALSESDSSLYLHIYASLYGGSGDASNIYWSPLQSVATLRLR